MMPQLRRVLEDYSIPVYSCSGYDSLTAKYDLREWCHDNHFYLGKRPVVLHLGDYDPSGEDMFEVIREDVRAFLAEDLPHVDERAFVFERVALTARLVDLHELPTAPPRRTDSRSKHWVGEACQLEALPPDVLAATLRRDVEEKHLDMEILAEDREREAQDRRRILRALPGEIA